MRQDHHAADDRRLRGPTEGRVRLGGEDVTDLPPFKRDVNTVFQSYALFPHLSVERNVAFGLERRKVAQGEARPRVGEALELVQLGGSPSVSPAQLSGGQQQRVALARALVNRPRALLLDEPLGALDLRLRRQLQIELKRIQEEVGITFVHVTHDQEEAMTMADTIAVMSEGRSSRPAARRALRAPAHRVRGELPRDLEPRSTASSRGRDGDLVAVETHDGAPLQVPADRVRRRPDRSHRRAAREDLARPRGRRAQWRPTPCAGHVKVAAFLGVSIQYLVRVAGGEELTVIARTATAASRRPRTGREVPLTWDPQHTFVVDKEQCP